MRSYSDRAILRRLLGEARPFLPHIIVLFVLSVLSIPLTLLLPVPLKLIVDSVLGPHRLPRFVQALLPAGVSRTDPIAIFFVAGLFAAVVVLNNLLSLHSTIVRTYTSEKLVLNFRGKIFFAVQRLSLAYHDLKGSADSVYRLQYDAAAVPSILLDGMLSIVTSALTVVGIFFIAARIDWRLVLVAPALSPFLALFVFLYRRKVRPRWHRAKELESSAMSVIQEALGALRVVKAFRREDHERRRFISRSGEGVRVRIRLAIAEGLFYIAIAFTLSVGVSLTIAIGALHVRSGVITVGDLLLLTVYLMQVFMPLQFMIRKVAEVQTSLASAERAFAILDQAPEVLDQPNARPLVRAAGAVAFRNVSFGYERDRPVLQNVSFEVTAGTSLGIAGKTGAGKTTLVNLLVRFYDPSSGQILVDGLDIREYRLADLRHQFAIVLQEAVLFSTTIAENIAYGRTDASEEDIINAARAANVHDFIAGLPDGYRTVVGERGMTLSGGERQRIALARAFLKDAPILILDEPTSSVDLKTEAAIMEAIQRLMRGRTTFIIAHRVSTLENCDAVLNLDQGHMVSFEPTLRKLAAQ
jgi:ATP-binding cassette, subfamily B, bacterial